MFIDKLTLKLVAGKGGDGIVAWRREKYIPKGGPSGGNGGKGGSIYLETAPGMYSLDSYRNTTTIKAENGKSGGPNNQQGKSGTDLILKVPCGTLIKDTATGEILYDLTEKGRKERLCTGGKGGKGNDFFKTPTNQAPTRFTKGLPGEEKELEFELKLIADIGLVGMPNAGKSTLLSKITTAQVKIGNYPFTTLKPNLSYIEFDDYSRMTLADIPGIIENAHKNRGLGLSFLKHIERCSALIYLIDISGIERNDPFADFLILREELQNYNAQLLEKPFLVVLNKMDCENAKEQLNIFQNKFPYPKELLFPISALNGSQLDPLIGKLRTLHLN